MNSDFQNLLKFDNDLCDSNGNFHGLWMSKYWTEASTPFQRKLADTIRHSMKMSGSTEEVARLKCEASLAAEWCLASHLEDTNWMYRDASEGQAQYSFDVLNPHNAVRIEVKVVSSAANLQLSIWDNAQNPTKPQYCEPKRTSGVVRVGTFLKPESRAEVMIVFDNDSNDLVWRFIPRVVVTKKGLLNGLGDIRYGLPGILAKSNQTGVYLIGDPKETHILVPSVFKEDIYYHDKVMVYTGE